jgi:hypothetical protein
MVIEPDDTDTEWPAAVDPIREAVGNLLIVIMQATADGSPARKRAMSEALEAHQKIMAAMADRRVIN